ncbi:MAG: hypothetical protein NUW01_09820 [Gemmatimonadaceae bacterium]|nr:hypothetical protein [Gemmatimonadaceae bacterium]
MAESNGGSTQTTRVQLGCGTLILIALIVMMFSDRDVDQKDIDELRDQLTRVEAKLDSLNARLGPSATP